MHFSQKKIYHQIFCFPQYNISLMNTAEDCPICLEPIKFPQHLCKNRHILCRGCWDVYIVAHEGIFKCPQCRQRLNISEKRMNQAKERLYGHDYRAGSDTHLYLPGHDSRVVPARQSNTSTYLIILVVLLLRIAKVAITVIFFIKATHSNWPWIFACMAIPVNIILRFVGIWQIFDTTISLSEKVNVFIRLSLRYLPINDIITPCCALTAAYVTDTGLKYWAIAITVGFMLTSLLEMYLRRFYRQQALNRMAQIILDRKIIFVMFLFSLISTSYSVLSFYNWFTLHISFFSILIALESALMVCSMVLLLVYDLLWFQLILLSFSWSFLLANVYERIYNSERSALRCFCSVFTVILYLLIPILNGFGLAHALTGSPSGDICINTRSGSEAKSCALFAKDIDFTIAHLAYVGSLLSFIWVPIGAVIIGRMAWRIRT